MTDFSLYFEMGWHHLVGPGSLDHILFIVALSSIYLVNDWKRVLLLVTAFTAGHSLTLALSVFDLVRVKSDPVEILIPCTIIITAAYHFFSLERKTANERWNYGLALFFGLVHGLAFASQIRFSVARAQSLTIPLLGFNLGLEVAQVLLVASVLLLSFIFVTKLGVKKIAWTRSLTVICVLAGAFILWQRVTTG